METNTFIEKTKNKLMEAKNKLMGTHKNYVIAAAVLLAFILLGMWSSKKSPSPAGAETTRPAGARAPKVQQTDVTVQQLQDVLEQSKKLTNLQRQETLSYYLNKQVQWEGTLQSASGFEEQVTAVLKHKVKPSWLLGQRQVLVTVNLPDSQKQQLLDVQKGSLVTYEGILTYTGCAKSPWLLKNGYILSVEEQQPQ